VCAVVNGSFDLAARAARLQAFLLGKVTMDTAMEVTVQWQVNRIRDARVFLCHSFVRRVAINRVTSDYRTFWRDASTEAFALYVIVAGCGCAPEAFTNRTHKHSRSRLARIT
jgi:hypothetical protein